jgi:hypothetical protein
MPAGKSCLTYLGIDLVLKWPPSSFFTETGPEKRPVTKRVVAKIRKVLQLKRRIMVCDLSTRECNSCGWLNGGDALLHLD